jgi:hypothetical protein
VETNAGTRPADRTLPAVCLPRRSPAALRSGYLRSLGVLLFLDGAVPSRAPHGILTTALRRAISERGSELATLLRRGLWPAKPSFWGV